MCLDLWSFVAEVRQGLCCTLARTRIKLKVKLLRPSAGNPRTFTETLKEQLPFTLILAISQNTILDFFDQAERGADKVSSAA